MDGSTENISDNHNIEFNLYDDNEQFCNLYLSKHEKEGYLLSILGKNGEVKPNMTVKTLKIIYFLYKF